MLMLTVIIVSVEHVQLLFNKCAIASIHNLVIPRAGFEEWRQEERAARADTGVSLAAQSSGDSTVGSTVLTQDHDSDSSSNATGDEEMMGR